MPLAAIAVSLAGSVPRGGTIPDHRVVDWPATWLTMGVAGALLFLFVRFANRPSNLQDDA